MMLHSLSVLVLPLCLTVPVLGEEPAPPPARRPKVGIAFAGGGARGGAHVGVLRMLEELRVPVDYIAGTSIGSVVGALYATGMSPGEMSEVLSKTDWDDALKDNESRRDLPYRQKEDDDLYLIKAELGFHEGNLVLPAGLVAGEKLGYLLRRFTLPSLPIRDFDKLPIPFRAVASDIVTGDRVVLEHGDLARAIRASMAIPGFFSPVEIDGKLLTDGGTSDNLPIDVVKDMGADVIIAIDISTPLARRDKLNTFLSIAGQTTGFLTRLNVLRSISKLSFKDVLVTPDLEEIEALDFKQFPAAEVRGLEAAREIADELRRLSVSEEEYAAFLKKQRVPRTTPVIDAVRVEAVKGIDARVIAHRVDTKPGPLDWKRLERDLARLYEIGDYETVDFRILEENGRNVLVFEGSPKPPAPTRVRLGLKLDTDFTADTSFGLRLGVYATRLNALRGEIRTRVEIGKNNGINFELYQPLDFRGRFFVSPTIGFLRSTTDTYLDGQNLARFRVDRFFAGLDLGISLGAYGEIRAGVQRDRGYVRSVIVTAAPISETVDGAGLKLQIVLDQLDSVSFPKKGWFFAGQLFLADTAAGGDAAYNTVRTGGLWAKSFGETTFFVAANADMKAGGRFRPYYDLATAGGFLNLSGLKTGELFGQYSGVARLVGYHRLARINSFLGTGIYAGGSLETGNAWESTDDIRFSNLRVAGSIFLAADTILGPLYFGAGLADRGRHSFYLSLGRPLN